MGNCLQPIKPETASIITYQIYKYNQHWGPYDAAMICGMVQSQQVLMTDLVCGENQSNWTTIHNMFYEAPQTVAPEMKQQAKNNKTQAASCTIKQSLFWPKLAIGALVALILLASFLVLGQSRTTEDERLIRQSVAEILNKPPEQLIQEDLECVAFLKVPGRGLGDIALIKQMKKLEELDLHHNQIEDLSPLEELKSLKYLDLAGNKISDLGPIQGLLNLKMLHLGGNSLKEVTSLAGLKNITNLDLGENHVENLEPLASLPKLEVVNLTGNPVKSLEPLFVLGQLKLVVMEKNSAISQTDMAFAQARLPNCQFIW